MQSIVITRPGPPESLQLQERPAPVAGSKEVLVKVAAAGINRPDVMQRMGIYPPPPGAPADIPGLEIAGTVVAIGDKVSRWKPGDRVCGLLIGGGYAGYCTVPEGQCLPVPDGISMTEAASLPETFFTVWSNLMDRAKLKPGESLLIHGGSSGIGVAAIQIAKAFGCVVYITAGSTEKLDFCKELGADHTINYKSEKFAEVVMDLTRENGVDVILDMVGGDYTANNLTCLAVEGRLVIINAMGGAESNINLVEVMRKRLTITGSMLRSRDVEFKSAIAAALEKQVWPMIASGRIKPVVYKTFPANQAAEAHRLMESSEHMGKIVLTFE